MEALATPTEVAEYLRTNPRRLAQLRFLGRGPRFSKQGKKVLYRWADVRVWVDDTLVERSDETPRAS